MPTSIVLSLGQYLCVANNGVGEEASHTVTLEVEFSPRVEAPRPRIAQAAEYDAVLTCKVVAFPRPSIHWNLDDGDSITNDDNYEVSHFSESNDVTLTTLKVKGIAVLMMQQTWPKNIAFGDKLISLRM